MSFLPFSQKVVGTRWVNEIKVNSIFKSRLVVQGWYQVLGIDYGCPFAPVCGFQSIHIMMLAVTAELDYKNLHERRPNAISQRRCGGGSFQFSSRYLPGANATKLEFP